MGREYIIKVQVVDYSKVYSRVGTSGSTATGRGGASVRPSSNTPRAPKPKSYANKFAQMMFDKFGMEQKGTFKILAYGRRISGYAIDAASNVVNIVMNEKQFQLNYAGNTRQSQITGNKRIVAQKAISMGGGIIRSGILALGTGNPIFIGFEALKIGLDLAWRFVELQQELSHFKQQQALENRVSLYERSRMVNNFIKPRGLS